MFFRPHNVALCRSRVFYAAMNQSTMMMVFSQLLGQSPVLLVYVGGIVVCALMSRRAPRGAMLALIGLALLLLVTVGHLFLNMYLINLRTGTGATANSLAQTLLVVSIGSAIIRAAGTALILAGVFAGRPPAVPVSGFEVRPSPPLSPR